VLGAVGIALFALVVRPRDAEERIALILGTAAVLAALGAGLVTVLVAAALAAATQLDRVGAATRARAR
jgi:hypothetical protein